MPRENRDAKARRLLTEGRLTVDRVDPARRVIVATVRGDSGEEYRLGFDGHQWRCTCPALTRCSHLAALMLVTIKPPLLRGGQNNAVSRNAEAEQAHP